MVKFVVTNATIVMITVIVIFIIIIIIVIVVVVVVIIIIIIVIVVVVVVVFNTLVIVLGGPFVLFMQAIGGIMLGIGIWVAVDPVAFDALNIANAAGMDDALWSVAIYTFIGIGAFLFVVGLFGCLGAARADRGTLFLWLVSSPGPLCPL